MSEGDLTDMASASIQHLCRQQILFQGREWQCGRCFNRNWVTVDNLRSLLQCEVCGETQSAPVSGDWHFRANGFVLEAHREHGVEAVVWTLWRLWDLARRSFFFAPSMWLWDTFLKPGRMDLPWKSTHWRWLMGSCICVRLRVRRGSMHSK